ncbi:hypothetical protein KFK09_018010 [Dendrobium nobile]|uniref:Uncharacterized protein n=1 Tax=Dendrobium nobile TaxID=94219 RepID=A0A8T3AVQ2_DENNO|nr:hypothetical protein KFK09_018010 [Dendrobium nobile]
MSFIAIVDSSMFSYNSFSISFIWVFNILDDSSRLYIVSSRVHRLIRIVWLFYCNFLSIRVHLSLLRIFFFGY